MMRPRRTFALNMIVGPNEADELARCLKEFHVRETFDEIVIVLTSHDENVRSVAEDWATTVEYYDWVSERYPYGNFGGARQRAVDLTKSDFIMWLDADDIMRPERSENTMANVRRAICEEPWAEEKDVVFAPYTVMVGPGGEVLKQFLRDRIFRRCTRFEWHYPVHETICRDWRAVQRRGRMLNLEIVHAPVKATYISAERNLRILRHEYEVMGQREHHIQVYFARDSLFAGDVETCERVTREMLGEMTAQTEMTYALCMDLAMHYAYGGDNSRPMYITFKRENIDIVERWARLGLSLAPHCAEPYVLLGDVYGVQGLNENALRMYVLASSKKPQGEGAIRSLPFYKELPARRMSLLYESRNDLERALIHNRIALDLAMDDVDLQDKRRGLITKLYTGMNDGADSTDTSPASS